MSGGSHDYECFRINEIYVDGDSKIIDKYAELRKLVKDLADVLCEYELWRSDDIDENRFSGVYEDFKDKWFRLM